jgi:hypothetical protein
MKSRKNSLIIKGSESDYGALISNIGMLLEEGRRKALRAVNSILVQTYWEIGRHIVEFEYSNGKKAEYGSGLFEKIAHDLRAHYGKGFSRSNVIYMRLLYIKYPKSQTLSDQLTWSHYAELLTIEDDMDPIGIVLAAKKNDVEVEYALGGISNKLFVSRYKLFLPDKKELEAELKSILEGAGNL